MAGGGTATAAPEPVGGLPRARRTAAGGAGEDDGGPEVLEAVRALIERVVVFPAEVPKGPRRVDLYGHLSALLRAAGVGVNAQSPLAVANGPDVFLSSVKGGAGTRKHLDLLLVR